MASGPVPLTVHTSAVVQEATQARLRACGEFMARSCLTALCGVTRWCRVLVLNCASQVFAEQWLTQTVRLYPGQPFVEFEWLVGPIPIDDGNVWPHA